MELQGVGGQRGLSVRYTGSLHLAPQSAEAVSTRLAVAATVGFGSKFGGGRFGDWWAQQDSNL